MKVEIEKIIQSDQAAQAKVSWAQTQAEEIRSQAREKSKQIITQKEREISTLRKQEIERILSEARAKSQNILEETDRYIEKLRLRKNEQLEGLIKDLLTEVSGF
ncbi:MAG: hypothetical protein JW786_07915 [Desulfobacterales bacterium]|nr:hypothetical protein [Desulfobacterales bacterium]